MLQFNHVIFNKNSRNFKLFRLLFLLFAAAYSPNFVSARSKSLSFHSDHWDSTTFNSTWTYLKGEAFLYYSKKFRFLQNFTENQEYDFRQSTIKLHANPSIGESVGSRVQGIESRETFQYGEIEWRAKILPSSNVLNIFRIGKLIWDKKESNDFDQDNLDQPAVQLVVQGGKIPTIVRADVFFPQSENSPDSLTPVTSELSSSDWISFPCYVCSIDLSKNFHNYSLKWSKTELVWSIDDIVIFSLNNARIIPRYELPIVLYLVADRYFVSKEPSEETLFLSSVNFRQNQNVSLENQKPFFVENYTDSFTVRTQMYHSRWRTIDGSTPDNSVLYVPNGVQIRGGYLQILVGPTEKMSSDKSSYSVGRVESREKFGFFYGLVEWNMKIHAIPGVTNILSLETRQCGESEGGQNCWIFTPPSVLFIHFENGTVKCSLYQLDQVTNNLYSINNEEFNYYYNNFVMENTSANLHKYSILWTKDVLVWYIDDVELHRVTDAEKIPKGQMFISMRAVVLGEPHWPAGLSSGSDMLVSMEIKNITTRKIAPPNISKVDLSSYFTLPLTKRKILLPENATAVIAKLNDSKSPVPTIVAGVVCPLVLCIVIIIFSVLKIRKLRASKGTMKKLSVDIDANTIRLSSLLQIAPTGSAKLHSILLQYMSLMEVPSDMVEISNELLGKGEFGVVFKGTAHRLPTVSRGPITVAIKTILHSADAEQRETFIQELKVMAKLGRHVNVVNLLGIVLKDNLLLLLEYCRFGSLLSFLKAHRDGQVYVHVDKDGVLRPFLENEMQNQWDGLRSKKDEKKILNGTMKANMLSTNDLILFSHQISRGMEYLVSRSIIHRDLAARNVLVADNHVLKISDFGLAKQGRTAYTVSNMLVALPVRWMPPDAILTATFSQSSDVWSFGVLLWEIFSLGETPFDEIDMKKFSACSFASWLMEGHQMERPPGAPTEIYTLMQHCWSLNPNDRPNFAKIQDQLDSVLSQSTTNRDYITLQESNLAIILELEKIQTSLLELSEEDIALMTAKSNLNFDEPVVC